MSETEKPTRKRAPTSGTRKGNGAGHGGPANGAGVHSYGPGVGGERPAFDGSKPGPGRGHVNEDRAARRAEQAEAMLDKIAALADDADHEMTRLKAMVHFRHEIVGTPVARNINLNSDDVSRLSDDELRAELARLSGAVAKNDAGDPS